MGIVGSLQCGFVGNVPHVDPVELLARPDAQYGRHTEVWLITVPAYDLAFSEALSEAAESGLERTHSIVGGESAVHEVGVMQSALELAEEQARLRGATRIHRITLRIGPLAGVEPEALAFAFDVVTTGTMAEGATLTVDAVPVVCFCETCAQEFAPADFVFACPRCGALSGEVRSGRELELTSLEVSGDGD